MSATSIWIRQNVDWMFSDWVFVLSAESRLAWNQLICYCKAYGRGGGVCPKRPALVLARQWAVGEESIMQMLLAARNAGALVETEDEWELTGWDKYQKTDNTNAERQARHREKVTPRNAVTSVTNTLPVNVNVSVSENLVESRAVTPREKALESFDEFYAAYPVNDKQKRQKAEDVFFARVELDGISPEAMIGGAKRYKTYCLGTSSVQYAKLVESFLDINERFWEKAWKIPPNGKSRQPLAERHAERLKRMGGTT